MVDLLASVYTASQMILFAMTIYPFRSAISPKLNAPLQLSYELLTPAAIWTVTEWLRTVGLIALPASYVGCIADISWLAPLLGWANVIGGLGVSALISLIPSALWLCLRPKRLFPFREPWRSGPPREEPSIGRPRSRESDESSEEREHREARLVKADLSARLDRFMRPLHRGRVLFMGYFIPPAVEEPLKVAGL